MKAGLRIQKCER